MSGHKRPAEDAVDDGMLKRIKTEDGAAAPAAADDAQPVRIKTEDGAAAPAAPPAPVWINLRAEITGQREMRAMVSIADGSLTVRPEDEQPGGVFAMAGMQQSVCYNGAQWILSMRFGSTLVSLTCKADDIDLLPRHEAEFAELQTAEVARLSAERPPRPNASARALKTREQSIARDAAESVRTARADKKQHLLGLRLIYLLRLVRTAAPDAVHLCVPAGALTFDASYDGGEYTFALADLDDGTGQPVEGATPYIVVAMGAAPPAFYVCSLAHLAAVVLTTQRVDDGPDEDESDDEETLVSLNLIMSNAPDRPLVLGDLTAMDAERLMTALDKRLQTPTVISRKPQREVAQLRLGALLPNPAAAIESFHAAPDTTQPAHILLGSLDVLPPDEADAELESALEDSGNESVYNAGGEGESYESEIDYSDVESALNELDEL